MAAQPPPLPGTLPGLAPPNPPAPNAQNPTAASVGRQFDYCRQLGARRELGGTNITDTLIGDEVVQALTLAFNRSLQLQAGLQGTFNQAVTNAVTQALADPVTGLAAVVNNAMTPILQNIERQQAKSHNHQSIGRRNGSLLPVSDAAGNVPAPGQFPRSVEELNHLRDGGAAVRAANHNRLAYLLNFYAVTNSATGAVYVSPPGPLPAGAAGTTRLDSMQRALENFLSEI